jgi:flagellar biosynthesis protein FlhA
MRTILETLADHAPTEHSTEALTELVRQRLHRRLSRDRVGSDGALRPLVIDPQVEVLLRDPQAAPAAALRLGPELARHVRELAQRDEPALVVVAPELRRTVAELAARHAPGLAVLSYREVDPELPFATRAIVGAPEVR